MPSPAPRRTGDLRGVPSFAAGVVALRHHRMGEALRVFSARLLLEPDDVFARVNRALSLLGLERWEEAVREFEVAVADPRADAVAEYHSLAWCYRQLDRPLDAALAARDFFERATLRHFGAQPTLRNLAWAAGRLGHTDVAIALLHQVVRRDACARDLEELAHTYWTQGLVPHVAQTLRFAASGGFSSSFLDEVAGDVAAFIADRVPGGQLVHVPLDWAPRRWTRRDVQRCCRRLVTGGRLTP